MITDRNFTETVTICTKKKKEKKNSLSCDSLPWHSQLHFKGSETKPYLRERILGGAYFNDGMCHVNPNSLQFSTRILVCTIMRPGVTVPHIDWF